MYVHVHCVISFREDDNMGKLEWLGKLLAIVIKVYVWNISSAVIEKWTLINLKIQGLRKKFELSNNKK